MQLNHLIVFFLEISSSIHCDNENEQISYQNFSDVLVEKSSTTKNIKKMKNSQRQRIKKVLRKELISANSYLNSLGLMIEDIKITKFQENGMVNMKILP
jgi:hypothetical protein